MRALSTRQPDAGALTTTSARGSQACHSVLVGTPTDGRAGSIARRAPAVRDCPRSRRVSHSIDGLGSSNSVFSKNSLNPIPGR